MLKEILTLKKQKKDLEENLINKSIEVTKLQENLEKHHLTKHQVMYQSSNIKTHLDNFRKDNQQLRTELNDARTKLISRDNLIKDLQDQINDPKPKQPINEEIKSALSKITLKLSQTNEELSKEAKLSHQVNIVKIFYLAYIQF